METKPRAALQTYHAIQATDLAGAFNDALKKMRIQPGDYAPELTAPEGPSTGGGIQAMQRLRLVSPQPGHPTLVVGQANHAEGQAELRSYAHLDAVHRRRFRKPLDIDRTQYEDFLRLSKQLLDALRLKTTIAGTPDDLDGEDVPAPGRSKNLIALAIGVLLLLAGLGAVWKTGMLKALGHG